MLPIDDDALVRLTLLDGQAPRPDGGTPGNPPSTAAGHAAGTTSGPDGTPANPPGTAAERALDRTVGTAGSGANPGRRRGL